MLGQNNPLSLGNLGKFNPVLHWYWVSFDPVITCTHAQTHTQRTACTCVGGGRAGQTLVVVLSGTQ